MEFTNIRYLVSDVDTAVAFYTSNLGFAVELRPAPGFASLTRGPLRLLLNAPGSGGAGQAMPDGTSPEPGGWNRVQLTVDDLRATYERLRKRGARFRNQPVEGKGGLQVLIEDPAGNCVELFEPRPARGVAPAPDDASEALEAFHRYTKAFGTLDPAEPAVYFHQPALMTNPNGVFVLDNAAAVERAYQPVMARLPAIGYARSTFPDLSARRLSDDLAVVSGACIWETSDGKPIQRADLSYTFRRTDGGWKILTALVYERP